MRNLAFSIIFDPDLENFETACFVIKSRKVLTLIVSTLEVLIWRVGMFYDWEYECFVLEKPTMFRSMKFYNCELETVSRTWVSMFFNIMLD